MTKEELIQYIKIVEDVKKFLTKSKKKKFQTVWYLKKKYKIKYLCKILNISRAGYYKWVNHGMKSFNKWDSQIATIIKTLLLNFKKIYGYNMLTLLVNQIYKLNLKPQIVYRYMKNMNLKSIVRVKRFNYKLKSGSNRHENLMNQDFTTTSINQKLGTDITYLLTNNKTYYLSIVKDFHTNEMVVRKKLRFYKNINKVIKYKLK
ncbi:hypothetical protein [Spiroplasma endosymbiont of Poecilobothrus nobilitatus]|uniref:hypothetical protein n=1 Tax=Spiroplasma endosymbiont of Poecilobothrus nobilitatus TaxID=1209220 RepID=UPI00313C9079